MHLIFIHHVYVKSMSDIQGSPPIRCGCAFTRIPGQVSVCINAGFAEDLIEDTKEALAGRLLSTTKTNVTPYTLLDLASMRNLSSRDRKCT